MANKQPKNKKIGRAAGFGRQKGTPNKQTVELKQALMEPFNAVTFKKWAINRPDLYFTQIVAKLLPKDLNIRKINRLEDLTPEELASLAIQLQKELGVQEAVPVAPEQPTEPPEQGPPPGPAQGQEERPESEALH